MPSTPKVALALASGGARGLAHIGVIQELESQGYSIGSIAGSSIGALIGGLYAAGTMDAYAQWVKNLDKMDVFSLVDFTFGAKGFIRGEKVFKEMQKRGIIPKINIEDLKIPFAALATDITNNKEVIFTRGDLYTAIRASVSIPNVFTPVQHNGSMLIDGGVLNPLPVDKVNRSKGDTLIAVDINALIPYTKPKLPKKSKQEERLQNEQLAAIMDKWNEVKEKYFHVENNKGKGKPTAEPDKKMGYFDIFSQAIQLMQDRITQYTLERDKPDVIIRISKDACSVFDFYKADELIAAGREACAKALKESNIT